MRKTDDPNEWFLKFRVEDEESSLRFRYILDVLTQDPNIECVEVSEVILEPGFKGIRVIFKDGRDAPENKTLQYLNIHAEAPPIRKSRLDILLEGDLLGDSEDEA